MADVKLGNTTHAGITRLELTDDEQNTALFMEADDFLSVLSGGSGLDYFENSDLTSISAFATRYFFSKFTTVYVPNVTSLAGTANQLNCENFIAPKLTTTGVSLTNGGAGKLKIADFGALATIGNYGLSGAGITTVILRGNTVPTVGNVSNQKANVTVYVPEAMLTSYQADATWQSLVSSKNWTLVKIEGSTYEATDWFKS